MTETSNKTQIIAEPGVQEVFIIREFDAARELVFRAFSEQKLLETWVGPKYLTMKYEHFDARSGGSYRYLAYKDGVPMAGFHGSIHDVSKNERIIQTFEFEGLPERGHVAMETCLFESIDGNRTRVTIQSVFRSVADRDGMIASGMELGVREGHEKLDDLLKTLE